MSQQSIASTKQYLFTGVGSTTGYMKKSCVKFDKRPQCPLRLKTTSLKMDQICEGGV